MKQTPITPRPNAHIVQRNKRSAIGPGAPAARVLQLTQRVNVQRSQTILEDSPGGKSSGLQAWMSQFDLDVIDGKIVVTIRIRAAIDSARFISNWARKVTEKWSNRFAIKAKERLYPIVVSLVQVTTGHHYDITVVDIGKTFDPKSRAHFGTEHMLKWGANDVVNVPHEVGHMLGNLDEYGKILRPDNVVRDYTTTASDTIMGRHSENNPIGKHYYLIEWAAKAELQALKLIGPTDTVETVPAPMLRHATTTASAVAIATGPTPSELVDRMASMFSKPPAKTPATAAVPPKEKEEESELMQKLRTFRRTGDGGGGGGGGEGVAPSLTPPVKKAAATTVATTTTPTRALPPTPGGSSGHSGPSTTARTPEKGLKIGGAVAVATPSHSTVALQQQLHGARVELISNYERTNFARITPEQRQWLRTHAWTTDPDLSAAAKKILGL